MKIARLFGFLTFAILTLAGCHELGHVDGPGDYGTIGGNDVVGEVRYVDARARTIEVRLETGRTVSTRYDDRTRVTYRQRDYAVSNLEPGDYVALRTRQDREGRLYTDLITVREARKTAASAGVPAVRIDGIDSKEPSSMSMRAAALSRSATIVSDWW